MKIKFRDWLKDQEFRNGIRINVLIWVVILVIAFSRLLPHCGYGVFLPLGIAAFIVANVVISIWAKLK